MRFLQSFNSTFLAIIFLFPIFGTDAESPINLMLADRVEVDEPVIYLGSLIEEIKGNLSEKQLETLQNLRVRSAPLPGRPPLTLTGRIVMSHVRVGKATLKGAGIDPSSLKIDPTTEITIHRKSSVVSGQEVIEFASGIIGDELNRRFSGGEYQIDPKTNVPNSELPFGQVEFQMRPLREQFLAGNTSAYVDIVIDGLKRKTVVIPFQVTLTAELLTARKKFDRHEPLTMAAIEVARKTLTNVTSSPLTTEQVVNKRAKYRISKGSMLTEKMIEPIPEIQKGNFVSIIAEINGVSIMSVGTALSDGYSGEEIRVRNRGSKKIVLGTVTKNGKIRVASIGENSAN